MDRKALFFDIDGTLFSEVNRNVPESASEALRAARAKGHLVFINTGRTYCLVGPIRDLVEVDGYLCGCGTRIIAEGEVLYSASIPRERGRKIKENILKYKLDGILEGTDGCYFRRERSRISQVEELRESISADGCLSPLGWEEDSYEFDKFCVMTDEESDLAGFVRSLDLDFDVIDRGNHFYECVPAGHSKATAIQFILNRYQIPLDNAYVFGDSTNDLPMFEYVPNAVLMGHHDRELEPYASFFTKNVEADGIEYAMRKLSII